jgi:hypothetical protein
MQRRNGSFGRIAGSLRSSCCIIEQVAGLNRLRTRPQRHRHD